MALESAQLSLDGAILHSILYIKTCMPIGGVKRHRDVSRDPKLHWAVLGNMVNRISILNGIACMVHEVVHL